MASKYDDLDASHELEQELAKDLEAALEPRGCSVVHHGANNGGTHAPGGKPDIEVRDPANRRLILVEVTKRKGSAADGEFPAITEHLNRAIAAGGYDDYCLLYVSPSTSTRMSTNIRDLYNRSRSRDGLLGRVVALDFAAAQIALERLATSDPAEYPAERLGSLFDRWDEAVDDARARQLVQATLFPEDHRLGLELENEAREVDAAREKRLKDQLLALEDRLRDYSITGDHANETLVYLVFLRLYEERRQRRTGSPNRFTHDGFTQWVADQPHAIKARYPNRMVEALLHEVAEDTDLRAAGLLRNASGQKDRLHEKLTDVLVPRVLEVLDQYDFHSGRVDVLGAVFETLARKSQKDTRIGQFFTPQQVVDFCTDLVELRPQDRVADPAVGTGRFLIRAMKIMLANADQAGTPLTQAEDSIRQHQLFGTDIDGWVATIAKMNMFIHGDGKSGIRRANGLTLGDRPVFEGNDNGLQGELDVVLTNPPLGNTSYLVAADDWSTLTEKPDEADRNAFLRRLGVVPMRTVKEEDLARWEVRRETSTARIQGLEASEKTPKVKRALQQAYKTRDRQSERIAALRAAVEAGDVETVPAGRSMKGGALFIGALADYLTGERDTNLGIEWRGGRAALIVDEAILNTPAYNAVRAFIRRHFYVKAVVSLDRAAFVYLAHTDAKTSVLYLVRKPHENVVQKEPIFYGHAARVGYSRTGAWVGDDLPQVLLQYRVFQTAVRNAYTGVHFDQSQAMAAVESLPGYSSAYFARLPSPTDSAERLDFYYARYRRRVAELEAAHGNLTTLGSVLKVAAREEPQPSRTSEYHFATINRVTATTEPKGFEETSYDPGDLWVIREGDLVASGIDAVHGSVALVREELDGLVLSKEMYRYRLKEGAGAIPEYLQLLLRTPVAQELLMGLVTGTSNRTRLESAEQLLELPIPPLPDTAVQEQVAAEVQEAHRLRRQALEQLSAAHNTANQEWRQPDRVPTLDPRQLPVADAELV